jgi:hypothetical protein
VESEEQPLELITTYSLQDFAGVAGRIEGNAMLTLCTSQKGAEFGADFNHFHGKIFRQEPAGQLLVELAHGIVEAPLCQKMNHGEQPLDGTGDHPGKPAGEKEAYGQDQESDGKQQPKEIAS